MSDLTVPAEQAENRFNLGLLSDVFKVLDAHGYSRGKDSKIYADSMTALLALTEAYEGEGA
jgi:Cft2 family RNA processing exonuclease